jgi:hypothetical protein
VGHVSCGAGALARDYPQRSSGRAQLAAIASAFAFFCRCHSEPRVAAERGERESRNLLFSLFLLPLPQEPDCTLSSLALAFYYSNQIGSAFRFERADLSRGRVYDNFEKA